MSTAIASRPTASRAPRNWLAEVTTNRKTRPTAAIIYGVPGIGKTSLAAQVPGIVFLTDDKEDGISTLKSAGLVPEVPQFPKMTNWLDVLDVLGNLATGEHKHRAIAIDALGGFERLCHEYVCQRDFAGDWTDKGFMGYMRGFEVALADWRLFLNAIDRLRDERAMSVFLLGHAKIAPHHNPLGPDYDRYMVDLHHKTWSLTHKWADMVLFANFEVAFAKNEESKQKGKARGGQTRILYSEHTAAFDAKNRHNLPSEIEMGSSASEGWANLLAAMKEGRKESASGKSN